MSGFSDLPATLRRRAMFFETAGYEETLTKCLRDAADEIATLRKAITPDGQAAVDAIADNRRLRKAMEQTFQLIVQSKLLPGESEMILRPLGAAIRAVKAPGLKRNIIAIEIGTNATRAFIEARVAETLDQHFGQHFEEDTDGATQRTKHTDHSPEETSSEEAAQPGGAGRDADQRPRAEAGSGPAPPTDQR